MLFHKTALKGIWLIELQPFADQRGEFTRTWCREEFSRSGLDVNPSQGSISFNPTSGTLRGLHWQAVPHSEAKIVRCSRGAIYDVVVDIDARSPTHRQWLGFTLKPDSHRMLYISGGFAHGFQTLVDDTEVSYLTSAPYVASAGRGLRYDDPALAIRWPLPVSLISDRDRSWPLLDEGHDEREGLRRPPIGVQPA